MKAGGLRLHAPILSAFVSCVRLCPSVGRPGQGRNSSHRSPRSPARRDGDTHGQGRVHCAPKEYAPWVHPPRGDIRVERGLARPKSQVLAQHGSRASSNPSKASKVSVTSPVRQLDFERGCPWCSRSLPLPLSLSPSLSLSLSLSLHPPAPVMSPYSLPHIKYNNPAKRMECLLKPAPLPIPLAFALL